MVKPKLKNKSFIVWKKTTWGHSYAVDSDSFSFHVAYRMTLGVSSTPMPCSRPWVTCCALATACTPLLAWQTYGSPSSAWSWALPALPCLWGMPLHSFSLWTPPGGSTKKRWVFVESMAQIWSIQMPIKWGPLGETGKDRGAEKTTVRCSSCQHIQIESHPHT